MTDTALNDGAFYNDTSINSGTGNYDSFLRIQDAPTEEGYNTNDGTPLDDKGGIWTHAIRLGNIETVNIGGIDYYVFRLDLNEDNSGDSPNITLTHFDLYVSDAAATSTDITTGGVVAGAGFTQVFSLDNPLALVDFAEGSGKDDGGIFVPVSLFAGADPADFVTLYASFGDADGVVTDGGFEEFRTIVNDDVIVPQAAAIALDKDTICGTDGASVDGGTLLVGSPITWTYTVTNAGNVAIPGTDFTVTDDQAGVTPTAVLGSNSDGLPSDATHNIGDADNDGNLDVGEAWVYSASGSATEGAYSNTGTVEGFFDEGGPNETFLFAQDVSGYTGVTASIAIDKDTQITADGTSIEGKYVLAGTPITWVYTVTNDGDVALANVSVTDDQAGVTPTTVFGVDGGGDSDSTHNVGDNNNNDLLDTDETWIFTATGVTGESDYSNTGTATADDYTDDCGNTASPSDEDTSGYFAANPSIAIDKDTICGTDGDSVEGGKILVGSSITWLYTVTNDGNVALSNVTVTDDQAGVTPTTVFGVDGGGDSDSTHNVGDNNNNDLLDTDETWIFSAAGVAIAGDYTNTGTASASFTDEGGQTVSGDDLDDSDTSGYTGVEASIHLEKVTTGTNPSGSHTGDGITITSGTAVTWTYTVTNDGDVPLSNIVVTDDQAGVNPAETLGSDSDGLPSDSTHNIGDANNDGLLDVGEEWIFSASGVAVDGSYSNVGTATGEYTDDCDNVANPSDDDGSSYTGVSGPGVRTPGFWYNNGSLLWDGNALTFPKAGDLGITNNPNTGTGPDLLYTVDTNHNGGIDGGDTKALLIGDWNKDGIANDEFDLFISRADALSLLNASTKQQQDGRWILGRDLVATWLNFLAGNGVGTASDLDSPHHYVDEGIAWMQHTTSGDNILLLTELTAGTKVATSSAAWLTGFDNVYGNNGAGVTNTYPIIDILGGSAIHTALDGYNNTGIINGHVYAFPDA
jgi:hypothetical protein